MLRSVSFDPLIDRVGTFTVGALLPKSYSAHLSISCFAYFQCSLHSRYNYYHSRTSATRSTSAFIGENRLYMVHSHAVTGGGGAGSLPQLQIPNDGLSY